MFNDRETYSIEESKYAIKNLISSRNMLWNGITRNVVIAGGFLTSTLQNTNVKDIDIFILANDVAVYNDLTQEFRNGNSYLKAISGKDVPVWSRSEMMNYNHNKYIVDVISNNATKAQYILTHYKTREELLDSFDYKHCKVSYVPSEDKL